MSPTQTILGSYDLVPMPDGTMKAVTGIINEDGKPDWDFVENRLKIQAEFEARFPKGEERPQTWKETKTDILTLKPKAGVAALVNTEDPCTRDHINAHLVSIFGLPERVLSEGGGSERITKLRHDRRHFATCCELMKICKDPEWAKVRSMLIGERP